MNLSMETAAFHKGANLAEKRAKAMEGRMKGVQSSFAGIGAGLGKVAGAFGLALSADALISAGGRAIEYASSLGEVSQQLGVTSGDLQRYRYIASQVGIEQAEMDKGLSALSKTLGNLAMGAKGPTEALIQLGFSAAEIQRISTMTAGQAMPLLADAFTKIDSPARQAALAADLFGGKLGPKFLSLLQGGSAGIDELSASYKKLGIELSPEQIKKADDAADKFSALKQVMEAKFAIYIVEHLPQILKATEDLGTTASKIMDFLGTADAEFQKFANASADFTNKYNLPDLLAAGTSKIRASAAATADAIRGMVTAAGTALQNLYNSAANWMGNRLNALWDRVRAKIQAVGDKFKWLWDVTVGHSYIPDMVDAIGVHMRRLDAEMVQPATNAATKTAEVMRNLQALLSRLYPENASFNAYLADLATLKKALDAGKISAEQYADALQRLRTEGMEKSEISDDILNAEPVVIANDNVDEALDSVLTKLPDLSKGSKRHTDEVIEHFANMASSVAASLQNMFSAFKGGGFWDKVQGVLGVIQTGVQAYVGLKGGKSYQNRANGGSVIAGRTYMVGERGKEFFQPHRSGKIIPSNDGGMGTVKIVPSPYFDVVVSDRAASVAAPMAGQAAVHGSSLAQRSIARRRRQALP